MRRARALRTVVLGVVPLLFTVSLAGAQILPTPCVPPPGNPPDDFLTGGTGVGAAIDFVGAEASAQFGVRSLGRGGRLVIVGLFGRRRMQARGRRARTVGAS